MIFPLTHNGFSTQEPRSGVVAAAPAAQKHAVERQRSAAVIKQPDQARSSPIKPRQQHRTKQTISV